MERAEAVVGKLEVKVEKAAGKGKKRKERGKEWEEVNGAAGGKRKGGAKGDEEGKEWEDEEMDEDEEEVVKVTEGVAAITPISGDTGAGGVEGQEEVEKEIL